jgi:tetratricopeptide (TPR) repeat protein
VRAAFDVSYQALEPRLRRAYRLLAMVPGTDLSPELAGAALGATVPEAVVLLDALAGASLLADAGQDRYRFHDLVRLHAKGQATDEEPAAELTAAIARSVSWYLHAAVSADIVITPGRWRLNPMYEQARDGAPAFGSPAEALEYLETIRPGLLAAVPAAHQYGLHEQAWQLCEALWGLLLFRRHYQPWIEVHAIGLAAARACRDPRAQARMLVQRGYAYLCLQQYQEAAEHFRQALTLSRQAGHPVGEATALEYLALIDLREGAPARAITTFTRARAIYEQVGRRRGVALMTRHIGEAELAAGRPAAAIISLASARSAFRDLPDPYQEARTLIGLGQAQQACGRPAAAAGLLEAALAIAARLGARHEEARIRADLAEVAIALGASRQARDHLLAALAIFTETGAPEAERLRQRMDALDQAPPGS